MRYYRKTVLFFLPLLLLLVAGVARADEIHIVQPGDTMWEISQQYGVPINDIVEANNLGTTVVMVGYPLIIPGVGDPTPTPRPRVVSAPAVVPANARQTDEGVIHPVQPGDTLFEIAVLYGVTMQEIAEANGMENIRVVSVGQELLVPGARLPRPATAATSGPAATPAPVESAAAPPPTAGDQLLPNSSFEEGWYFHLYNELQVPEGWKMTTDEGPNTLDPGSGGVFNRPEMRVVSTAQVPEREWPDFFIDGSKSVKVFKGGAPTKFAMFTDLLLDPGRYRMTVRYFPDIVAQYSPGNGKTWVTDPLAAEARVIVNNGGSPWQTVTAGQRGEQSYEFTVGERGIVRVGGEFRNRFETANNGWFLDAWSLKRIGN